MDFKSVEDAFEEAVIQGVFPGAVLLVGRGDEIVYEQAFGSSRFGLACALAWLLLTAVMLLTGAQFLLKRRWVTYND